MALEDLAGYSLRRGLGSGSVGTVWLLRDLASGRHAVLKRVPKTSIPSIEAFTEDVALARTIDHPHVARLLDVRESEGEWLLISQYVAAGTLAALLERRGPLSLGELVTLISPLAQGLAAMHRAGLIHGHLGLRDVMFDADGRPVITDAGLRLQEYPGSPAADLAALGNIARHAGGPPTVFTDTLFTGDGDQVSRRILQLASPEPIDLGQTSTGQAFETDEPKPDNTTSVPRSTSSLRRESPPARKAGRVGPAKRGTRRRSTARQGRSTGKRRWAYGVLVAGGVVAVAVFAAGLAAVGVLGGPAAGSVTANEQPTDRPTASQSATKSASPSRPTPASSPSRPATASSPTGRPPSAVTRQRPTAEAWLQTLRGLDVRRARAFSTSDRAELDNVYVPGSAPWASDRSLLASYQQQRIRVEGLRVQIESLVIEHPGDKTVVLRIVDRLVAGAAITSTGQRIPLPRGQATTRRVTLKASNTTWRISAITAA